MNITKRQLNKQLKSRTLNVKENQYMKHATIRVLRARSKRTKNGYKYTEVDIRVSAIVHSMSGEWLTLDAFGPRHIRKFLRRTTNNIPTTVKLWTKLWGFSPYDTVELSNIELVNNPCRL